MKKSKSLRSAKKSAAPSRKKPVRKTVAKRAAPKHSRAVQKPVRKTAKPVLAEKARLARNKKVVLAFYECAINQKDFAAARKYMGDAYTQHNPTAADGPEGLRAWLEEFKRQFPDLRAQVKRVIAEGDFVVLHVLGVNGPDPHGTAVIDIFRLENGKVVEHWDVIQPLAEAPLNSNSMF